LKFKKIFLIFFSLSIFLNPYLFPQAEAADSYLLSQNRPVFASSYKGSAEPSLAVDGDATTRWESQWGRDPQWIYVDLGATASITRVVVRWENAYAKSFRIEVSNNEYEWTPIYTNSAFTGGTTDIQVSGTGRYVRLYCLERTLPAYGVSVFEFEVYGTGGVNPPPRPPAPNVALNKPAVSSSEENNNPNLQPKDYLTRNATDGDRSTRWSSLASDPQWIYVDLGQPIQIGKVVLRWETAFGRAYDLQVSDDAVRWTTVYRQLHGSGGTEEIPLYASGRYVRLYGMGRGTGYGYSLYELEVYPYQAGDPQPTYPIPSIPPVSRVQAGSGSYEINDITQLEPLYPGNRTDRVQPPIPSNDWWQNLLIRRLGNGNGLVTLPLKAKYTRNGLALLYPGAGFINGDGGAINADGPPDLYVMAGNITNIAAMNAKVDGYGDFSVDVVLSDDSTAKMRTTLVKGSPYVYHTFSDPNAVEIYSPALTRIFDDSGATILSTDGSSLTADHIGIEVTNVDGAPTPRTFVRHYGVFAPPGTVFTKAGNKIKIRLGSGQNYLSIAVLPSSSDLNYYYQHGYAFVTNTQVQYAYDTAAGTITTTFTSMTSPKRAGFSADTLMALLPHQWKISDTPLTSRTYSSIRGLMKVREGNSFTTVDRFSGIIPQFAEPENPEYSRSNLISYLSLLDAQLANTSGLMNLDPYWQGKVLHPAAMAAMISHQIGDTARRDMYLSKLRTILTDWYTFSPDEPLHSYYFHYSSDWGTLFPWASGFGVNTGITDHHFTYGYFVFASAVLAAFDDNFKTQYGPMVEHLIRDYANPSRTDPLYPWFRNFDPYEGHSWAGGFADNDSGNNQEAAGEALNAWAAVYLWGIVTGNQAYRDAGAWGFTTELRAIEQYWFNYDGDNWIPEYRHGVAGQVWGSAYLYGTYFSGAPVHIYGIHWLPTAEWMSYYGRNPQEAADLYAAFLRDNGGPETDWRHIVWPFQSLSDPQAVIAKWNPSLLQQNEVFNAYWFIHNVASYGNRTTDIWAENGAAVGVYKKGTRYTAHVWNPTSSPMTVRFRNAGGVAGSAVVPPRTLAKVDPMQNTGVVDTQPPSTPGNLTATAVSSSQINLSWTASTDNVGVAGYDVYRNGVKVGSTTSTSYSDTGLAASTTYSYFVKARDAAGNESAASNTASATTQASGGGGGGSLVALDRTGWTVTTSPAGSGAANMLDGSLSTRWTTGTAMANGQYVVVDMQAAKTFRRIVMDSTGSNNDYARGYQVYVSNDGVNWGSAIASGTGTGPVITVDFAVQTARYIKIVQTGSASYWWSIHELNVYADGGSGGTPTALDRTGWTVTSSPAGSGAANMLDGQLSTRWTTGTAMAPGQYVAVDMKAAKTFRRIVMDSTGSNNDYARGYQVYVSNDGVNWGSAIASGTGTGPVITVDFAVQTARYIKIVQTGSASYWWSIHELNVYADGGGTPTALDRTGWTATSSPAVSGEPASNLLDGQLSTRWTTGTAMAPGQYVVVDMQAAKTFRRIVMDSTGSNNDYARGYEVYVSNDGVNWGSAIASGTGTGPVLTIDFAAQTARYIKIVQTGSASYWWSAYELNVYN